MFRNNIRTERFFCLSLVLFSRSSCRVVSETVAKTFLHLLASRSRCKPVFSSNSSELLNLFSFCVRILILDFTVHRSRLSILLLRLLLKKSWKYVKPVSVEEDLVLGRSCEVGDTANKPAKWKKELQLDSAYQQKTFHSYLLVGCFV